ncbi:MAG: flagellar hook-length control protein FliK [Rhizobacter sp.]
MTAAIPSFIAPPAPVATAPQVVPPQHQGQGFAQMLSQRQAAAHEAPPHHVAPKSPDGAAARHVAAPAPAPQVQTTERPSVKADKTDKTKAPKAAGEPAKSEEASASGKAEATDAEPIDPALADWLAALNLPAPAPEVPAVAVPQGSQPGNAEPTDAPAGKGRLRPAAAGLPVDTAVGGPQAKDTKQEPVDRLHAARESREKPAAVATDVATDAPSSAAAWQAAVERVSTQAEAGLRHDTPSVAALAAAAHAPQAAPSTEATAPVAIAMPTPATAPEFAHSLGVQVSVLARDGVQHAELHLNPIDMGPISVQIALDGTQAQVNFGADSAATRQIIEGGLPELAAALRDAGFTLSGGGVHSQAQGRGEGGAASGGDGSGQKSSSTENEITTRRMTARVSAGGVDLYA